MDATRCLCEEHDLILKVLDRLETVLDRARHNGRFDRSTFEPFLEFLTGFTTGAHFCKEEHGLFPLLHDRGVPHEGSPLAALEQEHELVRTLVREFSTRLESADSGHLPPDSAPAESPNAESALHDVLDTGNRLVAMLRAHIARADHCVFGMASGLLRDADPKEVEQAFSAAERRAADEATLQRWRALADDLAAGETGQGAGLAATGS